MIYTFFAKLKRTTEAKYHARAKYIIYHELNTFSFYPLTYIREENLY